jgi:hypothetical protein
MTARSHRSGFRKTRRSGGASAGRPRRVMARPPRGKSRPKPLKIDVSDTVSVSLADEVVAGIQEARKAGAGTIEDVFDRIPSRNR